MHQAAMNGDSNIFNLLADHGGRIEAENNVRFA